MLRVLWNCALQASDMNMVLYGNAAWDMQVMACTSSDCICREEHCHGCISQSSSLGLSLQTVWRIDCTRENMSERITMSQIEFKFDAPHICLLIVTFLNLITHNWPNVQQSPGYATILSERELYLGH